MAKRRASKNSVGFLLLILLLVGGIIITMLAILTSTDIRPRATGCNDYQCANRRFTSNPSILYMITNCAADVLVCDPDGNDQVCNKKGLVGSCGGNSYCCPASGQKWTTNMTACAGSAPYIACAGKITPTATPEPTPTPEPSDTPTPTPARIIYYTYVDPTPTPEDTPTPTPTSSILASCNKNCTTDADCSGGLSCVTAFGQKVCRNLLCSDQFSCMCNGGSFANLTLSPTPVQSNLGGGQQVTISVSTFTDSNGLSSNTPTITGLTEPSAKVTLSIFPDGVSGTVTADGSGRWSWRSPKTLSAGQKSLLVVAKNAKGDQGQLNQSFTVAEGKSGNAGGMIIVILLLVGVAFGGYTYYKSQQV